MLSCRWAHTLSCLYVLFFCQYCACCYGVFHCLIRICIVIITCSSSSKLHLYWVHIFCEFLSPKSEMQEIHWKHFVTLVLNRNLWTELLIWNCAVTCNSFSFAACDCKLLISVWRTVNILNEDMELGWEWTPEAIEIFCKFKIPGTSHVSLESIDHFSTFENFF